MRSHFVVLTGGPGAGKTAVMEAARQIFPRDRVAILPEAASIVYSGGFPRLGTPASVRAAQRAIAAVQRELERFAEEESGAPLVLCDRGIIDGAAYWPDGPEAFFSAIGIPEHQALDRYATVIHLHTPGASMGYDRSNPMRTESAEAAALLDARIEWVWAGHPRRIRIPATERFPEKLELVQSVLRHELESPPLPRPAPNFRTFSPAPCLRQ